MPDKHSRHNQGAWARVVLVNFLILALLVLFAFAYSIPAFLRLDEERMIAVASVSLFLVFAWTLWSWRALTGSLFNPYALFLMAAVLFNGGQVFLEILSLNEFDNTVYRDVYGRFSPETILETIFLVTLGLAAFHAGGLFSIPITYKRSSIKQAFEAEKSDPSNTKALRVVGWGLLAISIVPALVAMRESLATVSSYGYLGLFRQQQPVSDVFRILADAIVPATIFLLAGSRNLRLNIMVSGITVFSYCSALIFLGDRQGAVMLLVAWGWVYHRCIRPIPKTVLLGIAALILFIVLPVVAILRVQSGGLERFSLSSLLDTFSSIENPIVAILQETGFSMATVAYTIELVPSYREFDMGVSYLYAMSAIIPSLFWEVHPAVAHGLLNDWLIQTVNPVAASSLGNSYGFSFIAEAYLNFGWAGAPFALGIMGFLIGWLVLWADKSSNLARIAMVGSFTAFFLIYARGESNDVFRYFVWYALIPYLGVHSLRLLAKPRRTGVRPRSAEPGPATTRVGSPLE